MNVQGLDLSDIYYVIQWKATCDFSSLWQHFGRGGRGAGTTGVAILLVEKKWLDELVEEVSGGKAALMGGKRKRGVDEGEEPPGKRQKAKGKSVSKPRSSAIPMSSKQNIPSIAEAPIIEPVQPASHSLESSDHSSLSSLSLAGPS